MVTIIHGTLIREILRNTYLTKSLFERCQLYRHIKNILFFDISVQDVNPVALSVHTTPAYQIPYVMLTSAQPDLPRTQAQWSVSVSVKSVFRWLLYFLGNFTCSF